MTDPTDPDGSNIERLESRDAGETTADPYADVAIESLPDWWQRGIEVHEEHDLRPYRPPRFSDGTLKREVVERIESAFDVSIRLVCYEPEGGGPWEIQVDGTTVGFVRRQRSPDGYSVFRMDGDAFENLVRAQIDRQGISGQ